MRKGLLMREEQAKDTQDAPVEAVGSVVHGQLVPLAVQREGAVSDAIRL